MIVRVATLFGAAAFMLAPFLVAADCECGYSVNKTTDETYAVFTDLLESDFLTLSNITEDTDWAIQSWSVDKEASKGPYGRITEPRNVVSNPAKSTNTSEGLNGDQAGLELYVRKLGENEEHVSVAEVDSRRTDMRYGSFRAGIKATDISGTCGAFFWYLNDTQEIDMEFLSAQINETSSPVNLVLHSALTESHGGDAKGTPTYKVIPLPFNSAEEVHEYRFDWQPGSVSFYADGKWIDTMRDARYVPQAAGKVILSHWSNGNPLWSGGPPAVDAKITIQYVQAYFNSSDPARARDHATRCKDPNAANAICEIPALTGPPTPGNVHFFSQAASGNMTNNQTVYANDKKESSAPRKSAGIVTAVLIAAMVAWVV
ncbi:uncharacterized protein LAJ45_09712 [Morchella importuna]|uniref:Concanavalin A-like lectin/glucanase n=1 Tax=Morchella conica CCBAS932 TaxID=1392247 RepID=A0A3N4KJ16_9PEZI|nr:uncharacterized protein LAJ45_09712 [Morchella importuna]KAH8146270.1 hypothetical protein LAJ45_09712 [Morchella importuna]RPB09302.1 concanavalin A-like lectin/glucanase [Morchella conica CCBAS932]